MPITQEQLIKAAKSKGIDTTKYEQKMMQSPSQAAQPGMTQNTDINALIAQLTKPKNIGNRIGDAVSILGGGQPIPVDGGNDYAKLYAQEAIKKQFNSGEDELQRRNIESQIEARKTMNDARKKGEVGFAGFNDDGSPIWLEAPQDRKFKNISAGLTNPYQERASAEAEKAQEESKLYRTAGDAMGGNQPQQPGQGQPAQNLPFGANPNATPGTTLNIGPYKIPQNPEYTESEAGRISALPTMNKLTEEIKHIVQSPEYMQGNQWQHALRGLAVDQTKMPFLTHGDKFASNLQSKLANLKTTFFAEGGKALTTQEIGILSPLLEISGKSPERIIQDYDTFIIKYNEFLNAKKGGMYGYQPGQQGQQQPGNPNDDAEYQKFLSIVGQ